MEKQRDPEEIKNKYKVTELKAFDRKLYKKEK